MSDPTQEQIDKELAFRESVADVAQWAATRPENNSEFMHLVHDFRKAISEDILIGDVHVEAGSDWPCDQNPDPALVNKLIMNKSIDVWMGYLMSHGLGMLGFQPLEEYVNENWNGGDC